MTIGPLPLRAALAGALALAVLLAGCAPISRAQAEAICFERARLAAAPRGTISLGASTAGPYAAASISISSDYLSGADPAQLYDTCVFEKSGQMPAQPLYDRRDWKG